jgi:accessory gene regulator B
MFDKYASKITASLVENNVINEVESEIYSFGFKNCFVILTNIVIVLAIGFVTGMPLESLLFLFAFAPLRSCAGGIHTSSNLRCVILSAVTIFALLITANLIEGFMTALIMISASVVFAAVIYVLSPVQDANKPLDAAEVKLYKKRTKIVLCIEFCVLLIFLYFELNSAALILNLTLVLVCLSVCAGALKNLHMLNH